MKILLSVTARGNSSAAGSCSGWRQPHRPNLPVTTASGSKRWTGRSLRQCPHCHAGTMVVIASMMRPRVCLPVPDAS